jgi:hypothetical protein
MAAEVERARDAEKELLGQLKLSLARQQELETEHSTTAHQVAIKQEESAKLNGSAVQVKGTKHDRDRSCNRNHTTEIRPGVNLEKQGEECLFFQNMDQLA